MFSPLQQLAHLWVISVGTFMAPTLIVALLVAVMVYMVPRFWEREKGLELSPTKVVAASPWLALVFCLFATLVVWSFARHAGRTEAQVQFGREVLKLQADIVNRLASYDDLLRGAQEFVTTQKTDSEVWQAYVSSLHLEDKLPTVYGIGFCAYVPQERIGTFQRALRSLGESYTVFPVGERVDYFPIVYAEPAIRNSGIVGYDLGSDIAARTAAENSHQTNRPTLTSRIVLLDDPEHRAFLYFLPVTANGSLKGWIFSRFRQEDFLRNIMPSIINLQAFDDATMTRESLFFDSSGFVGDWKKNRQGLFSQTIACAVGDRHWTLHFSAKSNFAELYSADRAAEVVGVGLVISIAVFGLVWAFSSSRRRAFAWAQELTAQLRQREAALLTGPHGILITDATQPDNPLIFASPQFEKMTGYTSAEILGRNPRFLEGDDTDQRGLRELRNAMREGRESRTLLRNYKKDGMPFWNDLTLSPVRNEKGRLVQWAGVLQDVTEREQSERRLTTQIGVIRALSESTSFLDAAANTLRAICEGQDWELGAMWNIDSKANVLRCVDIWHQPETLVPEFETYSRQATYTRETGLPGHVWARGEAVWLSDIVKEANFPEAAMLAKEGLRSACGFPITNRRGMQGVLTFYSRKIWPLNRNLMLLMVGAGTQMSQYMERQEQEAQQKELTVLERGMAEFMGEGLVSMDREGFCIYANASAHKMLGYSVQMLLGKNLHDLLHPKNLGRPTCNPQNCPVAQSLNNPHTLQVDQPDLFWRQDKSTLTVTYVTSPIIDSGVIQGVVITFVDASGRTRSETELRQLLQDKETQLQNMARVLEQQKAEMAETAARVEAERQAHSEEIAQAQAQAAAASVSQAPDIEPTITPIPDSAPAESPVIALPAAPPPPFVLLIEEDVTLGINCATALRDAGYGVLMTADPEEAVRWSATPGQAIDLVVTDVFLPHTTGKALIDRLRPAAPGLKVIYVSPYGPSAIQGLPVFEPDMLFLQKPFTSEAFLALVRQVLS